MLDETTYDANTFFEAEKKENKFSLEETRKPLSGIDVLLNSEIAHERLPTLEIINDRLIRFLLSSLTNFTRDNVDVILESVKSIRLSNFLDQVDIPSIISVFKANEWDNNGLIVVGKTLSYSVIDILMGCNKGGSNISQMEGRLFTTIEQNLIKRFSNILLKDLSRAFKPIASVTFDLERIEIHPKFAAILRPNSSVIWTRLKVKMSERTGFIDLVIPYATIEPIREILLQKYLGEKFGKDSIWKSHLENELFATDVEVKAHLNDDYFLLKDVLNWKIGSQIFLNCDSQSNVNIFCGQKLLFSGKMGQKTGHLCIKIFENFLTEKGEENESI